MAKKIKIVENGPYLVTGGVPLKEKGLVRHESGYAMEGSRELPQSETYALCRCGRSKKSPFCDGSHTAKRPFRFQFKGKETASRKPYMERTELITGPGIDMLDDGRCAFLRFCHTPEGDAWTLLEQSDDPACRDAAIKAACDCPAGRLTAVTKDGTLIEPELEPEIEIAQDLEKVVSAGIVVKGGIPLESSDGTLYETRNRMVLCRCGKSKIKPFCDAAHKDYMFKDKH